MAVKLGPILNFRGCSGDAWKLSALVAVDDGTAPKAAAAGKAVSAVPLASFKSRGVDLALFRYDFAAKQAKDASTLEYEIDGDKHTVAVPKAGDAPSIAYGSCNGFSSLKLMKSTKEPNALWERLLKEHAKAPFHLLLLGGDQVYSDSMWEELDSLAKWAALPTSEGVKRDAEVAVDCLAKDGLLIFNDYTMMDPYSKYPYGIVPVVNDLCINHNWKICAFAFQPSMFCDIALTRGASA